MVVEDEWLNSLSFFDPLEHWKWKPATSKGKVDSSSIFVNGPVNNFKNQLSLNKREDTETLSAENFRNGTSEDLRSGTLTVNGDFNLGTMSSFVQPEMYTRDFKL